MLPPLRRVRVVPSESCWVLRVVLCGSCCSCRSCCESRRCGETGRWVGGRRRGRRGGHGRGAATCSLLSARLPALLPACCLLCWLVRHLLLTGTPSRRRRCRHKMLWLVSPPGLPGHKMSGNYTRVIPPLS